MPDERITGLLDRLAAQVPRKAPDGWTRAVLTGSASRPSAGGAIDYELPAGRTARVFPDYDDLFALYRALGWNAVHVELAADPSGAYHALAIDAAVSPWMVGEGYDAVLDARR
ncbi:hypothetical protein E1281_36720 [Actinomadura sp. KC345]|uniref:hypothetical protein n=1 Tax=Actinomadura sp. KC345 TaxID=2530371 RepID=UPI001048760B|nr:hypothetical protein [Actinomadura sp. KC345]TDC42003.1 hypothetical protein E1281_36720 [Actinomadura sp. KC345]